LLCPISRTFARFSSESKASDWDKPTCQSNRERQGRRWWMLAKSGGFFTGAKLSQALALITFAQEGYYFRRPRQSRQLKQIAEISCRDLGEP
jgi:hypothetical protein